MNLSRAFQDSDIILETVRDFQDKENMDEYLNVAKEAAERAAKIQKKKSGHVDKIEFKGEINLVTEVDKASEKVIIETIQESYPGHRILTEESGALGEESPYRWIVDPLDGTTNFAHGYPCFCVSIAVEKDGVVELGVIHDPTRDEVFTVVRGKGAFLNGKRISVSKTGKLGRSLLFTGFAYDLRQNPKNNIDNFEKFLMKGQAVRRDGAAAIDLAYVACGRSDGFWEMNLLPWDVAAGALMVEEAGGRVTMFDGARFNMFGNEIIASNGLIHDDMVGVIQKKL